MTITKAKARQRARDLVVACAKAQKISDETGLKMFVCAYKDEFLVMSKQKAKKVFKYKTNAELEQKASVITTQQHGKTRTKIISC